MASYGGGGGAPGVSTPGVYLGAVEPIVRAWKFGGYAFTSLIASYSTVCVHQSPFKGGARPRRRPAQFGDVKVDSSGTVLGGGHTQSAPPTIMLHSPPMSSPSLPPPPARRARKALPEEDGSSLIETSRLLPGMAQSDAYDPMAQSDAYDPMESQTPGSMPSSLSIPSTYETEELMCAARFAASALEDSAPMSVLLNNSTSTILASSTVSKPNVDTIVYALAHVLVVQIENDMNRPQETLSNLIQLFTPDDSATMPTQLPGVDEVAAFAKDILSVGRLEVECVIIALLYINRTILHSKNALTPQTWRACLLTAFVLAQKVWHDTALPLRVFARIVPEFSVEDLVRFEHRFLSLLRFDVMITVALYTQYYFEIRNIHQELLDERAEQTNSSDEITAKEFPVLPISMLDACRLEIASASITHYSSPSSSGFQMPSRARVVLS